MPDISFESFNPRSFEQFAQALAVGVLGPGIFIFGDGPDDGREAEYNGRLPYPSADDPWDGRTVMQAKFKQRLNADARDADWLVSQIRGEAEQWSRDRPAPNFYLVVTNVRLSGVVGPNRRGGQQKIEELFTNELQRHGVKELHVWHQEKIAVLLDGLPDLYRSYGAWLAPREVLASIFKEIEARTPNFSSTMMRFLQREMRDQRATRLQQAGHITEAPTPLERVFVDLPYDPTDLMAKNPYYYNNVCSDHNCRGYLLTTLLSAVSLKLDPQTVVSTWPRSAGAAPARHLILGGPGQGKSTITQFMAQIMRWRLLRDQPAPSLSPDIAVMLDSMAERLEEMGLPAELPRRYPVRVDLPTFADELADANERRLPTSLLDHIANKIAICSGDPRIDVNVVREWLGAYPWILLLDGLDEVPPSANRTEVLAAITDFWDEAAPRNADVAVVVTTRPQGYNDDLDPHHYVKLEMAKLNVDQALTYAERVSALKLPEEAHCRRVLSRLAEASKNETTALLMVSPLQVAILLQLIDQRGTAPTDRWTLFNEYLSVVTKREQEKPGEAGRTVRERERVIEGLVRRAGLLLHIKAEREGGAESYLSRDQLHDLSIDLLSEDGHEGEELREIATEIVRAATDRLVFLTQRAEGKIEFEVRSLQEFAAAAELMSGGDEHIRKRLEAIAARIHWQHVYRIAASKAFSVRDAAKYRDTILVVNRDIDGASVGAGPVRRGAAVSLELLRDGLAADQPTYKRRLSAHASELATIVGDKPDRDLISAFRTLGPEFTRNILRPQVESQDAVLSANAWFLLISLVQEPGDWADQLVTEWWPGDGCMDHLLTSAPFPPRETQTRRLVDAAINASDLRSWLLVAARRDRAIGSRAVLELAERHPVLKLSNVVADRDITVPMLPSDGSVMSLKLVSLDGGRAKLTLRDVPDGAQWRAVRVAAAFVENPSVAALAEFAEALADESSIALVERFSLPWMMDAVAFMRENGAGAADLARKIRAGRFGNRNAWERAERRWANHGIGPGDLEIWKSGLFFDERVATAGAPYAHHLSMTMGSKAFRPWLISFLSLGRRAKHAPAAMVRHILRFALHAPIDNVIDAADFALLTAHTSRTDRFNPSALNAVYDTDLLDPAIVARLAEIGRSGYLSVPRENRPPLETLTKLVDASQDDGILTIAFAGCADDAELLKQFACRFRLRIAGAMDRAILKPCDLGILGYAAELITASTAASRLATDGETEIGHLAALALANANTTPSGDAETLLIPLICGLGNQAVDTRISATSSLRRLLDRRISDLSDVAVWADLGLPSSLHERL